jgi:hypothetical protein
MGTSNHAGVDFAWWPWLVLVILGQIVAVAESRWARRRDR